MARGAVAILVAAAAFASGCGGDDDASGSADKAKNEAGMKKDEPAMKEETAMKEDDAMAAGKGATVKVVKSQFGRVIADGKGEAFYLFDKETSSKSQCYGACAKAWPPALTKGKPQAGSGARASLLGTTKRRDGKLQITYDGQPLYYYEHDTPGNILCQGVDEFGGLWLVVRSNGEAVSPS
jgi:predicted lipoprotein with Yx(FWY)xxD motif